MDHVMNLLFDKDFLITVFVGILAFATVVTLGVPRSVVFWLAGSWPCATEPRMTLARALARSGVILPTAPMV